MNAIEKGMEKLASAKPGSRERAYWTGFLDGINAQMADILKMMMDNGTAPKAAMDFGMPEIQVPLMLEGGAIMPGYAHDADAGMDLLAAEEKVILPHSRGTVRTGVHMAIPEGYFGAIRAKSGLLKTFGILCSGTVDSGYTGEIMVTMVNTSGEAFAVYKGHKIAQMILIPFRHANLRRVTRLNETPRGNRGFGSSGR